MYASEHVHACVHVCGCVYVCVCPHQEHGGHRNVEETRA